MRYEALTWSSDAPCEHATTCKHTLQTISEMRHEKTHIVKPEQVIGVWDCSTRVWGHIAVVVLGDEVARWDKEDKPQEPRFGAPLFFAARSPNNNKIPDHDGVDELAGSKAGI